MLRYNGGLEIESPSYCDNLAVEDMGKATGLAESILAFSSKS